MSGKRADWGCVSILRGFCCEWTMESNWTGAPENRSGDSFSASAKHFSNVGQAGSLPYIGLEIPGDVRRGTPPSRLLRAQQAEHDSQLFAPVRTHADSLDLYRPRKELQNGFSRGMEFEGRRDQQHPWSILPQHDSGEISMRGKLVPIETPFHSHPIIERLQREVNVLGRL